MKASKRVTKSDVAECFKKLELFGYKVYNFNSNRKVRTKDFVDHVIIGHGWSWFIEVKLYEDRLKPGQLEAQKYFKTLKTYLIADEENFRKIHDRILSETQFGHNQES